MNVTCLNSALVVLDNAHQIYLKRMATCVNPIKAIASTETAQHLTANAG